MGLGLREREFRISVNVSRTYEIQFTMLNCKVLEMCCIGNSHNEHARFPKENSTKQT